MCGALGSCGAVHYRIERESQLSLFGTAPTTRQGAPSWGMVPAAREKPPPSYDWVGDPRLTKVPLLAMAKFLMRHNITHDELAVASSHFAMARLAEERHIDMEGLLAEHERMEMNRKKHEASAVDTKKKVPSRKEFGSTNPARSAPSASSKPAARAEPTPQPAASSGATDTATASPSSRRSDPNGPAEAAAQGGVAASSSSVAARPVTRGGTSGPSPPAAVPHDDHDAGNVAALLGRLTRSELEALIQQKMADGTPVRRADLYQALGRGGDDVRDERQAAPHAAPAVGTLALNGVQYDVVARTTGFR